MEPEADGVATDGVVEVTKQLEKQAIEDKEKDEEGEEGKYLNKSAVCYSVTLTSQRVGLTAVCLFRWRRRRKRSREKEEEEKEEERM